ncbi:MAG: DUF4492 domain-containing protein [Prevotellaceae bacterium]|jgi:Na+/H+ antiporter NhaD/arsenite permease-like protein|nr:DUF4492 domain-containing protein [Prevotellaceae bacterium]
MLKNIFLFYFEGFKAMTIGKTLWLIILIKLAIMFLVLKLFFFPNFLKTNFENEDDRVEYVIQELTTSDRYTF